MKIIRMIVGMCTCFAISCVIFTSFSYDTAYAGTWDNAYTYYKKYGNDAVFNAKTKTNGYIYFATKGNSATSSTKYKTIGWKMIFKDIDNKTLQVLYFKLDGKYMKLVNSCSKDNYKYALYALPLSKMKARLNSNVKDAMNGGYCKLLLDACMVVSKNGILSGTMDDTGITSGKVYTSYSGILKAEKWSDAAKKALKSYFSKTVKNLFFNVNIACGTGIKSVTGQGLYCYGTRVTLTATVEKGYEFLGWTKDGNNALTYSFYPTEDVAFVAEARPVSLKVKFYRNFSDTDNTKRSQTFYYTCPYQYFEPCRWIKDGYQFAAWSESRNGTAKYLNQCLVSQNWILVNKPTKNLYALWTPNTYTIHFEGALFQNIPDISTNYEGQITLPGNANIRGWSLNALDAEPKYNVGNTINVKELVDLQGLQNENNATIILYALVDSIPQISAGDLFYSLEDAKGGRITESEIASHAFAYDNQDGIIAYGENSNNSFKLLDYDNAMFNRLEGEAVISLTFQAKNSINKTATKEIKVFVSDTKADTSIENIERIRFISEKYFVDASGNFVNENAGGLCEDSCWKNISDYYNVLMSALES